MLCGLWQSQETGKLSLYCSQWLMKDTGIGYYKLIHFHIIKLYNQFAYGQIWIITAKWARSTAHF